MERQNGKERPSPMLHLDTKRSEVISFLQLNTVENLRTALLLVATSPRNQWNLCTQELFLSEDSDWLCSLLNSTYSCYGEEMLAMLALRHSPKNNSTSLLDLTLENSKDICTTKALYGTSTGGACWHDKLFDTLQHMVSHQRQTLTSGQSLLMIDMPMSILLCM